MAVKKPVVSLPASIAKLASSGITPEHAEELGMYDVPSAQSLDQGFQALNALVIPYYDIDGSPANFYRIRYVQTPAGFAGQTKQQRYSQPASTLNWIYLPRVKGVSWSDIAADATQPLIITEGELKASCAMINGYTTIALGGVTMWQSSKKGVPMLPPLDKFNWRGRRVVIIFDSDAADNPQVALAQTRLADAMTQLGAACQVASLPHDSNGEKQGLDDFIMHGGDVLAVLQEARFIPLGRALASFNETHALVIDQDVVIDLAHGKRLKRDSFCNGVFANRRLIEYRPAQNGNMRREEILVPLEWLRWSCRRTVNSLVYEPGAPTITPQSNYNIWRGWGCEPREGTIEPWNALLDFLFDGFPEERVWFERWCAYPIQNPGAKLYASAVLWGPETGTGKSLIGYTLGRIYGENFAEIGNAELHATFNEWAVAKQFVLGDEITGSDRRNEADKLKQLITQQKMRLNTKFLPTYEVKDCLNYYFTSNHPDAFFLDDQDRRFFIHRVPHQRRERAFYRSFMLWLDNGGASFLFQHLLDLDLGDFEPAAPAPLTESKMEMVDHSRSDIASFVANLKRNAHDELERLKHLMQLPEAPDLVLNKHVRHLYDPDAATKVTSNGLGREMSRHGFKSLKPVETSIFGKQRFYALRNEEKWLKASASVVREYIDKLYANSQPKKGKF